MLEFLFVLMVIALLWQDSRSGFFAAAAYVTITLLHDQVFGDLTGWLYYFTATYFDLGVILLLAGIQGVSKMILRLQLISIASMVMNLAGWLMYEAYYPPDLYNMGFIVIYVLAVITIFNRDRDNVAGIPDIRWLTGLFGRADSWASHFLRNKKPL